MPNGGYGAGRDQEYASRLDAAIEAFATRYEADTSARRRTVILFPGGMGSQLMRARRPHNHPPFSYYKSWLACNIVFEEAKNLQLSAGRVDDDQQYVIPDGAIDFIEIRPYVDFIQWCWQNWIHLFVFGWDWRRSVQASVDFFLGIFMPKFEARFAGYNPNPLDDFTLVGHSAGGMVVKVIANEAGNACVQRMRRAITVATPFYGYGGQIHRFLVGDPDLNWTMGGPDAARSMVRIISSMPGGYEFLYLDNATYQANQAQFANDSEGYNLNRYPSMDKANPGEVADPYNPLADAQGRVRYPANYGFSLDLLHEGLATSRKVSSALDPAIAAKFYNIRGVQAKNDNRVQETVVSQLWGRIAPQFNPDQGPDPIDDSMGFGDGVQPAWTTRLLGLPDPATQVITVVDDFDHMTLMNERSVQQKIARLLGLALEAVTWPVQVPALVASRAELNQFLDGLRPRIMDKTRTAPARRKIILDYFGRYERADLHKLLARGFIDALKSPSQKASPPKVRGRGGEPSSRSR